MIDFLKNTYLFRITLPVPVFKIVLVLRIILLLFNLVDFNPVSGLDLGLKHSWSLW